MKKLSISTAFILIIFTAVLISSVISIYYQNKKMWEEHSKQIDKSYDLILNSQKKVLAEQIWLLRYDEIETSLEGFLKYPFANYVQIKLENGKEFVKGKSEKDAIKREIDIKYRHKDQDLKIAHLVIQFSSQQINFLHNQEIKKMAIFESFQFVLLIIFMFLAFKYLLINRLKIIEKYLLSDNKEKNILALKKSEGWFYDELDIVARSINSMQNNIYAMLDELSEKHQLAIKEKQKAEEVAEELQHEMYERTLAEEELKKQNILIYTMLGNLPIGIFMVKAEDGVPIIANEVAKKLLGRGVLPDASSDNLHEIYQAYKTGTNEKYPVSQMPIIMGMQGEFGHIDDMEVERPDGKRISLEIFGCPVYDSNNKIWASLVGFMDITDRKRAEQEIKRANDTLKKSRISALNLMEDAIDAKKNLEQMTNDLRQQTAELTAKNDELTKFNKVVVGREIRMIELKKEINELCEKLGEVKRYPLDFLES